MLWLDALINHLDKVVADWNRVDVHEDLLPAKLSRQAIIQMPGVTAGVIAPIADEDAWHTGARAERTDVG